MKLDEFDYTLPKNLIAQKPLADREASRLLVLDRKTGDIQHRSFSHIGEYLGEGDVLVLNDTRVIPARLLGRKEGTGGRVEVLLLTPLAEGEWEVLVKPGRRARPGTTLVFGGGDLTARVLRETSFGGRVLGLEHRSPLEEVLDRLGKTPLPPYIKEKLEDSGRYQTVYAKNPGSCAAPTAGLHFTPGMLQALEAKGVELAYLTLHIGLGTFRPVETEDVQDHPMHREFYILPPEAAEKINRAREAGGRVVAVGTTACRTLEACGTAPGRVESRQGWTDLFIYPGYDYRVVDILLTNFHLPKSTLIMLVSAFAGLEATRRAYEEAVAREYRFYSFGDAMLVL